MSSVKQANEQTDLERSFLKWAGNKFRVLPQILEQLPKNKKRLIEAFAGSGVLFSNTSYPENLLIDINCDLINVYQCLQRDAEAFIAACHPLFSEETNREIRYYQFREEFNHCTNPTRRAALFIYLNRHCYNGLCRYNSSGFYNVPFGRYKYVSLPEAGLRRFHEKAQHATFLCANFLELPLDTFKKSDVIYCDPPYAPLPQDTNFTRYSFHDFNVDHQACLVKRILQLNKQGVTVIVSNHDTPLIRELYQQAEIVSFEVKRFINRNVLGRGSVKEILAVFV